MTDTVLSPRQRDLLATPQWSWLTDVVATWYAAPLCAADGVEDATGTVAGPLADWFALVGNRLYRVQDEPATPETSVPEPEAPGLWTVWTENQGCWRLVVGDDGQCRSAEDDVPFGPCPLPEALKSLVLAETLVGAWSGEGVGPLGALADTVCGGLVEDATVSELDAVAGAFPDPGLVRHPFFPGTPLRGDATTLVRGDDAAGFGLEWAAATAGATAGIDALVPLDPSGGVHLVEVSFRDVPLGDLAPLFGEGAGPAQGSSGFGWLSVELDRPGDGRSGDDRVGDLWSEQSGRSHRGTGSASCSVRTRDVAAVVAAVERGLASLPGSLAAQAVVAARPERVNRFTVLRPEGRGGYRGRF